MERSRPLTASGRRATVMAPQITRAGPLQGLDGHRTRSGGPRFRRAASAASRPTQISRDEG